MEGFRDTRVFMASMRKKLTGDLILKKLPRDVNQTAGQLNALLFSDFSWRPEFVSVSLLMMLHPVSKHGNIMCRGDK